MNTTTATFAKHLLHRIRTQEMGLKKLNLQVKEDRNFSLLHLCSQRYTGN
jgi:hypothetical protein